MSEMFLGMTGWAKSDVTGCFSLHSVCHITEWLCGSRGGLGASGSG